MSCLNILQISELLNNENGSILPKESVIYRNQDGKIVKGTVNIAIRPGYDDYIIHENRHGNQLLQGTFDRPVLEVEREAFIYQRVYNPSRIANIIENARATEYKDPNSPYFEPAKRPLFYGLDDAIKYIYRDQIK